MFSRSMSHKIREIFPGNISRICHKEVKNMSQRCKKKMSQRCKKRCHKDVTKYVTDES